MQSRGRTEVSEGNNSLNLAMIDSRIKGFVRHNWTVQAYPRAVTYHQSIVSGNGCAVSSVCSFLSGTEDKNVNYKQSKCNHNSGKLLWLPRLGYVGDQGL